MKNNFSPPGGVSILLDFSTGNIVDRRKTTTLGIGFEEMTDQ
jgi:hypothetical protein